MGEQAHIFEIKLYCENKYDPNSKIPCNSTDIIPLLEARFNKYEWAWIIHDQDKFEDGKLKKAHAHFLVRATGTTCSLDKIRREFSVSYSNVYAKDLWNDSVKYLAHRTKKAIDDGKFVYPISNIHSNFDLDYLFIGRAIESNNKAALMIQFVVQYYEQNMSLLDLCKYAQDIGEYNFFERNFSKIVKIIEDERKRTYRFNNYNDGSGVFSHNTTDICGSGH